MKKAEWWLCGPADADDRWSRRADRLAEIMNAIDGNRSPVWREDKYGSTMRWVVHGFNPGFHLMLQQTDGVCYVRVDSLQMSTDVADALIAHFDKLEAAK